MFLFCHVYPRHVATMKPSKPSRLAKGQWTAALFLLKILNKNLVHKGHTFLFLQLLQLMYSLVVLDNAITFTNRQILKICIGYFQWECVRCAMAYCCAGRDSVCKAAMIPMMCGCQLVMRSNGGRTRIWSVFWKHTRRTP